MNVSGEIQGKVDNFSLSPHYLKHPFEVKLKFCFFLLRQSVLLHFLFNSPAFSNNLDLKTFQKLPKYVKIISKGNGNKSVWKQQHRKRWSVFKRCRPEAQCSGCSVIHACDKMSDENCEGKHTTFL